MDKWSWNYTKWAISQFMHQSSTSSPIGCLKTDNQSIIILFQGEVKYLNLTHYHFLRALNLFRLMKHTIIILGPSISNSLSRNHTIKLNRRVQVLNFTFQFFIQYPKHARKWSHLSQNNNHLTFDKTIHQFQNTQRDE